MHIERFVCCLPRTEGGNELEIITGAAVAVMVGDMPSYRLRELFRNISSCSERSIVDEEKKKKGKKEEDVEVDYYGRPRLESDEKLSKG